VPRELCCRGLGNESGQVDDAAYAGARDRVAHGLGTQTVPVLERPRVQRVDEVADPLHVSEGQPDLLLVGDVAAHPVDLVAPGEPPG
jgi:hypothetical protein